MRERSIGELTEDVEQLRQHVDARMVELAASINQLRDRLDNAPYVRNDLHSEQIQNIRGDIKALRTVTMWLLGLLVSSIVGAIIVLVVSVASGTGG